MILAAAPAWAHHAFAAEFDAKKPVHLEGVVTKVELINPHTWIHVDVKGPDGKVTTWMVEAGSPNVLLRRGFTKATLAPGTPVVVDGYQSKDGSTARQRPRYHAARRPETVPRLVRHRRAVRRKEA